MWRSSFDYWLATKAAEAGAEVRDKTAALSCEEREDCVLVNLKRTSAYSEKAKLIVVCDGVVGSIKRKLVHTPQNNIVAYQTFNRGSIDLDYHYFHACLQPHLSEYDAWFSVKDDYLMFGVSVKDMSKIEHYYSKFIDYMATHYNAKIKRQEMAEKWLMPRIMPGCPIEYGNGRVLFAGETAGFLNPMGEGISAGMESGYAAAKAIEKTEQNSDLDFETVHSAYKDNTSATRAYMTRQWNVVACMASTFDHMRV